MHNRRSRGYFIGGIIICLLGAVCFSTKAIFVKLAYRDTDVSAVPLLMLRMLFSLPFFVTSAMLSSQKKSNTRFTLKQWLAIATIGCLGYYISSLLDFIGLQYVSAGIERLILFVYPTMVLLMTSVFFRQKVKPVQWTAVVITYAGLFLALTTEMDVSVDHSSNFILGCVLIFICAVTYASYIVGSGRLIPIVGSSKFNSYAMSFACVGVLLHYFFSESQDFSAFVSTTYYYGIAMALISTVIPSYMISEGIRRIGSNNAAIVGSVGPVSTILQAYFFLGEPILPLQIFGTILILGGVLMISVKSGEVATKQ